MVRQGCAGLDKSITRSTRSCCTVHLLWFIRRKGTVHSCHTCNIKFKITNGNRWTSMYTEIQIFETSSLLFMSTEVYKAAIIGYRVSYTLILLVWGLEETWKEKGGIRVKFTFGRLFNTSILAGIILLDERTFEQNFSWTRCTFIIHHHCKLIRCYKLVGCIKSPN